MHEHEIAAFEKECESAAEIGLSIGDSKELLLNLQQEIVAAQAAAFCSERSTCPCCGGKLRRKGNKGIHYRTIFGDITIGSLCFYPCHCHAGSTQTFSPLAVLLPHHVAPEMLWLETKWAFLVSYGVTVDLLKDVLLIGARLNAETAWRHKGLNNRAENSHLPFRKRERTMQGFRSLGGLQRFVAVRSAVQNGFSVLSRRRSAITIRYQSMEAFDAWKVAASIA